MSALRFNSISRRAMLRRLALGGGALLSAASLPGVGLASYFGATQGWRAPPGVQLGMVILDCLGEQRAEALVREHAWLVTCNDAGRLADAIAVEYREGRTLTIKGWLLSEAECAVCIARALIS